VFTRPHRNRSTPLRDVNDRSLLRQTGGRAHRETHPRVEPLSPALILNPLPIGVVGERTQLLDKLATLHVSEPAEMLFLL
jgi:hypothetical protein